MRLTIKWLSHFTRCFLVSRACAVSLSTADVFNLMFHSASFPRLFPKTQLTLASCSPVLYSLCAGSLPPWPGQLNPGFLSSGTLPTLSSRAHTKAREAAQACHSPPQARKDGRPSLSTYSLVLRRCFCSAGVLRIRLLNFSKWTRFVSPPSQFPFF